MKVAVCISGLPRFWTGFPLNLFPDADYFIHTWRYSSSEIIADTGWHATLNNEAEAHSVKWSNMDDIEEVFRPKVFLVEDYNKTTKDYFKLISSQFDMKDGPGRNSVIPMFYGINKVIFSAFTYSKAIKEEYDVVVRCRFDTRFTEIIKYESQNGIFIPNGCDFLGINDQFAYGDMESMVYYSGIYLRLIDNLIIGNSNGLLLNPEVILLKHLQEEPIQVYRFNHDIKLER